MNAPTPTRLLAALLAFLLTLFAACAPRPAPDFRGTDISGEDLGRTLALTDHHGVRRSLADFRGKLVVVSFGYTHCPDVCPTTLADLATALASLRPEEAAAVQVLFVSVDPERDTPELLRQYVPYFHPSFLALTGDAQEVAAAAAAFRVHYRRHQEAGVSTYLVDHTAGSFVLDGAGKARLFLPFAQPPADIAHDLRLLLRD